MTNRPRIVFSRHADDMIVERQLDRAWIEETIFSPEITEPDPHRPSVKRAFRCIPERGNRYLRVAYVETRGTIKIITIFLDRGKRPRA